MRSCNVFPRVRSSAGFSDRLRISPSLAVRQLLNFRNASSHEHLKAAGVRLDPGKDSCGVCPHDHSGHLQRELSDQQICQLSASKGSTQLQPRNRELALGSHSGPGCQEGHLHVPRPASSVRRYPTLPYAHWEASQKMCTSRLLAAWSRARLT
ncbi:hypothetical protein AAFF_G00184340 [Aldrovandia affinis]|uniref:Uncharacterized protein n=1 Tax=Aldrovandia affinis TaxID=143900 RepID=A0AAD7R050_9TELE|nr:hypothetical protein AAFF_G00184340 [Aldrovandia affinis]